jgi:hypothetical protein
MIAAALLILAQGFPPPAPPGPPPKCLPHREMVYRLANEFMEFARWQGIDVQGAMLEWFGNEESGTWTLVRTTPDMQSCYVTDGQGFSASMPNPDAGNDDPRAENGPT